MCGAMVPGTVVFAAAYGTLAAQKGLSLTEAVLMSALVFGGASQLVALEVWTNPLMAWTVVSLAVVTAIAPPARQTKSAECAPITSIPPRTRRVRFRSCWLTAARGATAQGCQSAG